DYEGYWEFVNNVSNPNHIVETLFPLISVLDSVFAAQLLLSGQRPQLYQTRQTCETGPGSPSGHSGAAASALVLFIMFFAHCVLGAIVGECNVSPWLTSLAYPVFAWALCSVMIARMYVAEHFPHQYRHDTKSRSILISAFATALILYSYRQIDDNLCRTNTLKFYISQFIMFCVKPMLLLRVVPAISMWPFTEEIKAKTH
ncbi:Glucose-6-phosphatase, partial [Operophtera brumata]